MAYCSMACTVVWHFANELEVEWLKEGSLIVSTDFHFDKQYTLDIVSGPQRALVLQTIYLEL